MKGARRFLFLIPLVILVPALMFRAHVFHFPFRPATPIAPADAALHIGQYVSVRGRVADVVRTPNGSTFLDLGAPYPNEKLAVVVERGASAQAVGVLPGERISVNGRVALYRGRPEIVVRSAGQIAQSG